jgi:glycosyltransferase involved in cell wall biosynthesis
MKDLLALAAANGVDNVLTAGSYHNPKWRGRLSRLLWHPSASRFLLQGVEAAPRRQIIDLVREHQIDVCILGWRYYLFLLPELSRHARVVIDWTDSNVRLRVRELRARRLLHRIRGVCGTIKELIVSLNEECVYGRFASANLITSEGDKRYLDLLSREPTKNYIIPNGVDASNPGRPVMMAEPGRLIFSGVMDYPPNYHAALWFIRYVLPAVRRKRPDVRFVVAGRNPPPELIALSSDHIIITGSVDNLRAEIARSQLYVAPLISGTGFKNKIVEALAEGVFVVGTEYAAEFLAPAIRSKIPTASKAAALAELIIAYLDNPAAFADDLRALQQLIQTEYRWEKCAQVLADVLASGCDAAPT